MEREPVLTVAAITAGIGSLIALAVAFGAPISPEQSNAILATIPFLVGLIGAAAAFLRGRVASPSFVEDSQVAHLHATHKGQVPLRLQWPSPQTPTS